MKPHHKKQEKFTDLWINQTRLGEHFGLSAIAIGKKLLELGLRGPDKKPTERALADGFCRPAPLKDGTPFFLWNKRQVSELLRAQGAVELSDADREAFEWAKAIVELEKQPDDGLAHKMFDLLLDDIPPRQYPAVNAHLKRLGSEVTLD